MEGNLNKKISNHDIIFTNIKNKIYFWAKIQYSFKEVIVIIDNKLLYNKFSGFKKLNGSQLNKNDVTYFKFFKIKNKRNRRQKNNSSYF